MPLFGRKSQDVSIPSNPAHPHFIFSHTTQNTNISGPVAGHPISVAQPLVMQPAITPDSHPDTNQPTGTFDPKRRVEADALPAGAFDPRRRAGENILPAGAPPAGPAPDSQEWQRQHEEGATQVTVEEKMPFKEQVKAWAKVHRGTVSLHYRIPIELQ